MSDYISREEITKWLEEMQLKHPRKADAFGATKIHVNHIPAADVRPVVVARLEYRHTKNGDGLFCTNCGELWTARKIGKYCYNCGADMSEYFTERKRRYEGG